MGFWGFIVGVLAFIWYALVDWLSIFALPFINPNLLWIVIPIWFGWLFAEFFQEKRGTSLGNAISNGIIPVYVSVDWIRFLTNSLSEDGVGFSWDFFFKFLICALVIFYGLYIIYHGIKGKSSTRKLGRIRIISYLLLMFTPIIYGVAALSIRHFLLVVIFFPLFYYLVELIDMLTPDPTSIKEASSQKEDDTYSDISSDFSKDFSSDFNKSDSQSDPFKDMKF